MILAFMALVLLPLQAMSNDILVLDDFNDGTVANNLRGDAGAWEINPADDDQFCRAWIESNQPRAKKDKYLRIDYDVESPNRAANGYWTQLRGLDASRYDHLEFWVRGDPQEGFTTKFRVEFKKPKKQEESKFSGDEMLVGSYLVTGVTDRWQKVSIPLNLMNGILDWTDLQEFVIVFKDRLLDQKKGTLYIDDIVLVRTGNPGPSVLDEVPRQIEKGIRGLGPVVAAKFLIEKRLGGFPSLPLVKKEFPRDDTEFLRTLAKDTWKFFEYFTDRHNGLPLDTIALSRDGVLTDKTFIGDYTNVTNIGLYLMVLVSAHDLGLLSAEETKRRLTLTMDTIARLETAKGFPYNYYDTSTLERTSHFLSFVDSGWLAIGLYVTRNAFADLAGQADAILRKMDFKLFYDDVEQHMYHGYYTNIAYYSEYHYGVFYAETRAISYMAIGRGDAPMAHWFELVRTFPAAYDWQRQTPRNRVAKEVLGFKFFGGHYQYDNIPYVPSWGGSLFEALMPTLVLREKELGPQGLGLNDLNHTLVHIQAAKEKLGYPIWGMSPCSVPAGGYSEYGVEELGSKGYPSRVVTPHVTFLALEFAPQQAIANLRKMIELYDIYGECGFYDAVDPSSKEVAMKWLALDQAMILIALNNYLNDGAIRRRFHAQPMFQKIESLLSSEKFLE